MQSEPVTILLFLLSALTIAGLFHWLIGWVQRRLTRRFLPVMIDSGLVAQPAIKPLLISWCGNALRLAVWILFALFAIELLPQTRTQFATASERLFDAWQRLAAWLVTGGINALITVVVTIFLLRFAAALIKAGAKLYEQRARDGNLATVQRRTRTLSAIFSGLVQSVIFFVGLMILLQQLNLNVTPILASAGVVGIAVGFGAQSLIKDLFAGFLILLEDQFSVGDSVKIGEVAGTVEHLTLRATRVRALDGALTTIPNGSITIVSNLSKDWSRVVLDVEIDYAEDVDRAMQVMLETARQVRAERPEDITDEPAMLGVDKLAHQGVTLRLTAKTVSSKQAEIARELRRRVKRAFDQAGIKAPAPELKR